MTTEEHTFQSLGVCDELVEACDRLNYKTPTPIQVESLPYTLQGKDIIALAETGSGKTLSFALPILQNLLNEPSYYYALIMAPTRELCIQISEHFEALGSGISLKSCIIVGGLDPLAQAIALQKKPHIIIGTPGRLLYHLQNTKGFNLRMLKYLVFDEADKLLNMDFEKEINQILDIVPKERKTLLFSATMTDKVTKLQRASLKDPVKVSVSSKYQTVSTLVQNYLFIPAKDKDVYLVYMLNEFHGNSIFVFINTCMAAMRLYYILNNLGMEAVAIHGQMNQVQRLGALTKFKSGQKKILIATDVASRGLDIPSVDLVINYDIPQNAKDYVHRVGRTARAGRAGKAITIVSQYDVEGFQKIEELIEQKLDQYKTEENEVMIFYERVQEAQRIANQEMKEYEQKKKSKGKDGGNQIDKLMNKKNEKLDKTGGMVERGKKIKKNNIQQRDSFANSTHNKKIRNKKLDF